MNATNQSTTQSAQSNKSASDAAKEIKIKDRRQQAAERAASMGNGQAAASTQNPLDKMPVPKSNEKKAKPPSRVPDVQSDIFGSVLTLNFSNGKELQIDFKQLPDEMQIMAGVHGLKQKLVDAAAIARTLNDGKTVSIDEKYEAVKTVYDRITGATPSWNANRSEGESKSATGGVFLRAMCELTGKDQSAMREALDGYTKEQMAALKKNPKVIQKIADIQLREASKTAGNGEDLLAGLMG